MKSASVAFSKQDKQVSEKCRSLGTVPVLSVRKFGNTRLNGRKTDCQALLNIYLFIFALLNDGDSGSIVG
jgi:hypothetical protein